MKFLVTGASGNLLDRKNFYGAILTANLRKAYSEEQYSRKPKPLVMKVEQA